MTLETQKQSFAFSPPPSEMTETVLYAAHSRRIKSSRFAPFAGYRMPLWFSSIRAEHKAVRKAAGLFDCAHMGVFSIQGAHAEAFLNIATTNDVTKLQSGQAQYSYLLDAEGSVLDDIIVYCRASYDYLMVVNAANKEKVKAWLNGLLDNKWIIDPARPDRGIGFIPKIQDHENFQKNQRLVDIAIQGPKAADIIASLADTALDLAALKSFHFQDIKLQGISCL
ncbi:MAG: hypothetical protein MI892_04210, partial [Desulfobacterales bacterium]|nr:hypothetical protein [Desulfobacterales bacterium]